MTRGTQKSGGIVPLPASICKKQGGHVAKGVQARETLKSHHAKLAMDAPDRIQKHGMLLLCKI